MRDAGSAPTFLSLFSGAGGLDLGMIDAGWRCQLAIDADEGAIETHTANLGAPGLVGDLSNMRPPRLDVDAIVAGPPCQGFSTLGKRDPSDPRNELLRVPAYWAAELKPSVVVIENVGGARAGPLGRHLDAARSILRAAGYQVDTALIDMSSLGVPQRRRRIVILAWRESHDLRFDLPTQAPVTLRQTLRGVDNLPNHAPAALPVGSTARLIARHIKPGQKLCNVRVTDQAVRTWDIPEVFGTTTSAEQQVLEQMVRLRRRERRRNFGDADPVSAARLARTLKRAVVRDLVALEQRGFVRRQGPDWDLTHTFNGKYRRPHLDGLAPAVDTRFGDYHYVLHPAHDRAFTAREAARIQGFPDRFTFSGSRRHQFRLIANAVPPPVGRALGTLIFDQMATPRAAAA